MQRLIRRFAVSTAIAFLVLAGLSFTPLAFIPALLNLVTIGWEGVAAVLIVMAAPFGGFLFVLLFSRHNERTNEIAALSGVWVGAIAGSLVGVKFLGAV